MLQWLKVLPYLAIEEKISVFITWDPLCNFIVSTWDPHSIKHHLPRTHLKQPVTHVRGIFTDRKTLVYDPLRDVAQCQLPTHNILPSCSCSLPQLRQIGPSGTFEELFCTYCDPKLCWLFLKIAKQLEFSYAGYFCNIIIIIGANCKSGYWKTLSQHLFDSAGIWYWNTNCNNVSLRKTYSISYLPVIISILQIAESYWKYCSSVEVQRKGNTLLLLGPSLDKYSLNKHKKMLILEPFCKILKCIIWCKISTFIFDLGFVFFWIPFKAYDKWKYNDVS